VTTLRPYQLDVIADYEAARAEHQRILLTAPTGAGKTVIFAEIIRRAVARYQRALVIAHRREIITQTSTKLREQGIAHGIIQAGFEHLARPQALVQVASIQTLHARAFRSTSLQLPPADLVIIDECHHARALTYGQIIDAYPNATLLGPTATPCRGDGRGLGNIFTVLIECPQIAELIVQGYLVKSRVFAPVDPDLKGVRTQSGDYVLDQLAHRMNTDELVADITTSWLQHGERRRTVAFAVDVAHSVHIRDEFLKAGVRAEHIDGSTPKLERDAILKRLESGETEVVSNCMVLTEGWDCPPVGCGILARPTKQMGLYRQMIGRLLRPYDGKPDAVILDHSGACFRHGLPEDRVDWSLDVDHRAAAPAHEARKRGDVPNLHECPQCKAVMTVPPCAACGWMPKPRARAVDFRDGELGLVSNRRAPPTPLHDPATRMHWHGMLAYIARERGYQRGWVAHKYREKFGSWPAWGANPELIEPTPEARSWVRHRMIAYAKARGAA
jgi:DNA repair protein RadD